MQILRKCSFRKVSGNSPETLRKLCLSAKFRHQKISWKLVFFAEKLFRNFTINSWRSLSNTLSLVSFCLISKLLISMRFNDFLFFIILFKAERLRNYSTLQILCSLHFFGLTIGNICFYKVGTNVIKSENYQNEIRT